MKLAQYGYRVTTFQIARHMHPEEHYEFDNPALGSDGMLGLIHAILAGLKSTQGDKDVNRNDYLRIDSLTKSSWGLVLEVSGGSYGETFEVVDITTHKTGKPIGTDDALLRKGHIVIIVPPTGKVGLIISESKGLQHHGVPFANRLHRQLVHQHQLSLSVMSEVADTLAWNQLLDRPTSSVTELSFVNDDPSKDDTPFKASKGVVRATLALKIGKGTVTQRRVSKALKASAKSGRSTGILSALGIHNYDDGDFDEHKAVIVEGESRRTLSIEGVTPRFMYVSKFTEHSTPQEFLSEVRGAAQDTLKVLGYALPAKWWPVVK